MSVGILACATAQAPETADRADGVGSQAGTLTDVWVEREGDASVITLVGLQDPVYTAFLLSDPNALILDISSVEIEAPAEPVAVYDGLVEQVSLSSFSLGGDESMTRVEVALSQWADYEIVQTAEGLAVRLRSAEALAAAGGDEEVLEEGVLGEEDPWSDADALEPSAEIEVDDAPPLSPATAFSGVEVTQTQEGVLIHLRANGMIAATESFTLEDPARLVIDLPGLENASSADRVEVDAGVVKSVRIGSHSDKVRVVIDGGEMAGAFEGRRLVPSDNGLFVALGSGEDLDEALAMGVAAPAVKAVEPDLGDLGDEEMLALQDDMTDDPELEMEELVDADADAEMELASDDSAAPEDEIWSLPAGVTTIVHGIHFDSQSEKDRIVVLSEGLIDFEVLTPDAETVVLRIPGASIPREAEGRIIPPLGGPVSLITAFHQPDVEPSEVRVVVKRAPDLEPTVTRRGELIFMDFAHTGVAASAPPAFSGPSPVLSTRSPAAPDVAPTADLASGSVTEQGVALQPVAGELEVLDTAASMAGESTAMADPGAQSADAVFTQLPQFSQAGGFSGAAALAPASPGTGAAVPASLEPPAAVELLEEGGLIDGKEYKGRRISLDFKDVEITDVLRIIAEVSDLNIVAGEEVEGSVTIRLVDVPWDQALDVILLTKALGFVRVGNVLRIAPSDILSQEEEVRLQERRNKEKLEDLVVKLQPVNYGNVKDVSLLVKRLLSARGTVNIDERTNTLIIKDISSVVDEATALVKALDTQTPQVVIEAKIVEANLDFSRELGAFWGIGSQPLTDGFDSGSAPKRNLGGQDFKFHDANSVIFSNPITSVATGLASLNAFVLNDNIDISVQLAAAESSGHGKVISSPRIVTLDNREAEISQGVSIPFQTFENGDAKLEFIDAVLRLRVTPHNTSDRSIIMKIEIQRNAPDDSVSTPTGSPAIAKNEAKTETLVKDGQTLVIGGIYTVTKTQRE
ncbi:MAG: type IV pilus secretin PilQ, partial [Proteobacteria bacterium]|nr:type IV pilus secretin PilQ [Pseudomonadota bacterium]